MRTETSRPGRDQWRSAGGRHHARIPLTTVLAVLALVSSTAVIAVAPGSAGAAGAPQPVLSAFDHTGAEIDLPYFDGPIGSQIWLLQGDGIKVVQQIPMVTWPEQETVDLGLRSSTTVDDDRHCTDDELWPRQTLAAPSCFTPGQVTNGPGTWFVDVPLTVSSPAGPLVFDRWEQSDAVIAGPARCRTGEQGAYDVPWAAGQGGTTNPAAFTTAAQFRLWMDPATGAGLGAEVEAHYALATAGTPDTTAPLVSVTSPIDCYWYAQGEVVPAEFDCLELGLGEGLNGTGVESCEATDGSTEVAPGEPIDTATVGEKTLVVTATDAAGNSRSRTIRYRVDGAAPELEIATTPAEPNAAGWFGPTELGAGGELPLVATASDEAGGSSIGTFACTLDEVVTKATRSREPGLFAEPPPLVYTADPISYSLDSGVHTVDCSVVDRSGQTTTATHTVKVDTEPPTPALIPPIQHPDFATGRCPHNVDFGLFYPVYQDVPFPVRYINGADAVSGLVVPGEGWIDLDVSTPGVQTVHAPTMVDAAGNESIGGTCTYFVIAADPTDPTDPADPTPPTLSELGAPVNAHAVNVAKAGRTIPFKFSATRDGVAVTDLTTATTSVTPYACDVSAPTDDLDVAGTASSSGLVHLGGGHYQYDLQTAKSWAGGCYHLGVTVDGATTTARFAFTR